ncbi:Threonine/homoserine/homoserine lactone efflux protein [Pseudoxanthobacter soli DSM 19599]|uniref:Threonine/homoserine/homoserine lactone efflux protein n=1 Tax=Pseudoxanthobacter soli DSM 19599 TaxID=1123029 RepID=A0A1M7ZBR8_9HYPH|nr:LysE family translocator [Pseudoxanthobacter soli]SHO62345.1 Threonine/homoserine/homoserine lactone efflux protein [Pseudoxanthobacter soli DSM 19599]
MNTSLSLAALAGFAFVYALAVASPGPGMTALVARTLGGGWKAGLWFTAGILAGDLVWFAAAAFGLSALAHAFHLLFLAVKYAGMAYLVFIAWKLWTAPVEEADVAARPGERPLRVFASGLALTLGNPKTMVFYLAILPTVIDLTQLDLLRFAEITGVVVLVLPLVSIGYIALTLKARAALSDTRARVLLNRIAGTALAGAAAAIAWR